MGSGDSEGRIIAAILSFVHSLFIHDLVLLPWQCPSHCILQYHTEMETLVGSCLGNALTLRGEHQFVPYDTGTPGLPECSLNSLSMQPESKKKKKNNNIILKWKHWLDPALATH